MHDGHGAARLAAGRELEHVKEHEPGRSVREPRTRLAFGRRLAQLEVRDEGLALGHRVLPRRVGAGFRTGKARTREA